MCHFHSVIVTGDGRILHDDSNSHSTIAHKHGLHSGLDAKWWECEWDGRGSMPVNLVQSRGKDTQPTAAAERAAQRHYEKLAAIVAGDCDPSETAPFDAPEYKDVRAVYKQAMARKSVEPIVELIEQLDYQEDAIREIIEQLGLDINEIAKERIEELESEKEELEREKESEFERGYESAYESGDLICYDTYQEDVEKAKEEGKEEGAAEVAYQEYVLGVLHAKAGAALEVDYINGMPSFLFD